MWEKGLISIITPAYNAEKFIVETIESVLQQTYVQWELIIANDNSKDKTKEIVQEYAKKDARIKLINLAGNSGPALARNAAIGKARGQYLAFLDSDDKWFPEKIDKQIKALQKSKAVICFTAYRRTNLDGSEVGKLIEVPLELNYEKLLYQNVIGTLTVVIDREKTGPVKMTDAGYDDYVLWLEVLKNGSTGIGINEDLARYRKVDGSISSNKFRAAKWIWNIYRNIEGLSFIRSFYYFFIYSLRIINKHRTL